MELLEGTFMSIMLLFVVTTLHESNELKLQQSLKQNMSSSDFTGRTLLRLLTNMPSNN